MKVYLQPEVILVWRPTFVEGAITKVMAKYGQNPTSGWRRDLSDGDGDGIPELYGRMCYSSFGPGMQGRVGAEAYHANILESGHGSVLETASWGFAVFGASRGFLAQMTRHRAGFAYAAESTHFERFTNSGERGGVEPGICVAGIPESVQERFITAAASALKDYELTWQRLRDAYPSDAKVKKVVSGSARGLLPTALECRLGFSANARALRHLCQLRGNPSNVLEIRLVAAQVTEIMLTEAPSIFQDFSVIVDEDGWPTVKSKWQKV